MKQRKGGLVERAGLNVLLLKLCDQECDLSLSEPSFLHQQSGGGE